MDGHDRSISDISKIINSHKWDQVGAWDQVDALFHFLEADSDPSDPRPGHDAMAVLILQHIHQISHHWQVRIKLNLPQETVGWIAKRPCRSWTVGPTLW
jgi:hypothetical protein